MEDALGQKVNQGIQGLPGPTAKVNNEDHK